MSIKTKITVDNSQLKKGMKDVSSSTQKSLKKIHDVTKKVSGGLGALGGNLSGLGKIAGTLISKFALVGASIAFILKGIKETWDDLMLSPEEYMTKQNFKIQQSRENTTESLNRQNQDNGYFQRLQELSNQENLSNVMKQEAIKLVQILTKKYGDLGIQIDLVSGQILNLDSAQSKMLQKQAKQLYKNLSIQTNDIGGLVTAKMKASFTRINENNFFSRMLSDFIQQETGLVRGNVAEGIELINAKPLQQQIRILQKFRQQATRESDIKDIQEIIELKKQQLKIQQKLSSLEQTGAIDEKTAAARLKDRTTRDTVAKNQAVQVQEGRKQRSLQETMQSMQSQAEYARLTKTSEQIVFLQNKLSEEKQKQKNLSSSIADIESRTYSDDALRLKDKARILDIQEKIKQLEESHKNGTASKDDIQQLELLKKSLAALQSKVYPHDAERSDDLAAVAKLETEIKQSEKQQLRLQIQIQKLEEKSNRFYQDRIQNYEDQLAVQKLLLQGKFEQAQKQKLINQLKRQGLKIDEKRIAADEAKRKELAQITIQKQLQNDAKSLYDRYAPKTKEYRTQKRIEELQERNKTKLTDQQKDKVKQLVEFEMKIEQVKNDKPDLSRYEIKTNQLTARGGFAGGAVSVNKDTVNEAIKNNSQQQLSVLKQIKALLQNGGLI